MALDFDIVIVPECVFKPFYLFFGLFDISCLYQARYFTSKACRAYDKPLVMLGKSFLVGTRVGIEAFGPCL